MPPVKDGHQRRRLLVPDVGVTLTILLLPLPHLPDALVPPGPGQGLVPLVITVHVSSITVTGGRRGGGCHHR